MYYLRQSKIVANLILMSFVWLSTSFCYYLILMLTNTFDDVYVTGLTNGSAEVIAYFISGLVYERIGVKLSLFISFLISAIGGVLILAFGLDEQDSAMFFTFFLLAKFGVTCCFNINYSANRYFFPTLFAATALGVCNFLARLFSALSFLIGGLDEPTPMIIFTILCSSTAVASVFLRTETTAK